MDAPHRCLTDVLTLFVLGLFPHEDVTRRELLTLAGGETSSDERQYALAHGFKDDMSVPGIPEILDENKICMSCTDDW